MRERDGVPNPVQSELTSEAVNPTLIAGDIFMTDERGESSVPPPSGDQVLGDLAHGEVDLGVRRAASDAQAERAEPRQGIRGIFRRRRASQTPSGPSRAGQPLPPAPIPVQQVGGVNSERLADSVDTLNTTIRTELTPYLNDLSEKGREFFARFGQADVFDQAIMPRVRERMAANEVDDRQEIKRAKDTFEQSVITVESSHDEAEVRRAADRFVETLIELRGSFRDEEAEALDLDAKIATLEDPTFTNSAKIKKLVKELAPHTRKHFPSQERRDELIEMPQSLEGLVDLIMNRAGDQWQTGGRLALIDEVPVGQDLEGNQIIERRVNAVHFYEWMRRQMFKVHDFNSTSPVSFFSDDAMGVKTTYRTINFAEIILTESFFKERRVEKVSTGRQPTDLWTQQDVEAGVARPEQVGQELGEAAYRWEVKERTSKEYEQLRQKLLMEVYLLELYRNGDLKYVVNRAGKEMLNAIKEIFDINPMTKSNFLEIMLSLPSMSRTAFGETGNRDTVIQEKVEVNGIFGEAIRRAWGSYQHMWDYDMVVQYLGEDAPLFQAEYDEYHEDEYKDFQKTGAKLTGQGPDFKSDWFDRRTGKLKVNDKKAKEKYMDYINIHLGPSPDDPQWAEVRERMVQSIMQSTGISYVEAKIAEVWAYSLCHFTGIGGRGDTTSVGFDQLTKETNTREYRLRQWMEQRRAEYGSIFTLNGIKRTILTFMEATRDKHGRALYEIVQGGQGSRVDIEGTPIKNIVDLERGEYARDSNGYIIFKDKGVDLTSRLKVVSFEGKDSRIIFKDKEGEVIEQLGREMIGYSVDEKGDVTFIDVDKKTVYLREDGSMYTKEEVRENGVVRVEEVVYRPGTIIGDYVLDEKRTFKDKDGNKVEIHNGKVVVKTEVEETIEEPQGRFGRLKQVALRQKGESRRVKRVKVLDSVYAKPLKYIVFRNNDGSVNEGLAGKFISYELDKDRNIISYTDKDGNTIHKVTYIDPTTNEESYDFRIIGDPDNKVVLNPREVEAKIKITAVDAPIRFAIDTQRQFTANVMEQGGKAYEFLIEGHEFDFRGMIEGYNPVTGRPILNQEKMNKVKGGMRKALTYSLSTWTGTDYTKTIRTWEKRYIEDKNGNIIFDEQNIATPDMDGANLVMVEQSLLSTMFDDEVLAFIQLEVNSPRRTIGKGDKKRPLSDSGIDVFRLQEYHDVLTDEEKKQLKLAVWTGVFTYYIAKEIEAHRDPKSNLKRYTFDELKEVYDVLSEGGFMYEDEQDWTRENTNTGAKKIFGEEFAYALGAGQLDGFWQMIQALAKQSLI